MSRKDDLAPFVLKDVHGLGQGEERGSGAYGFVRTVTVGGAKCIAKQMHNILHDKEVPPLQQKFIRQKFRDECKMLSKLRHPNIVHFVGVHYGKNKEDISLIMEALDTDLSNFILRKADTPIPLSLRLSILLDVTYGLLYLHSIPIIHRDLNLNNILLTQDLRAKIADLGVSKYLDMTKRKSQTMAPGAWDYMPPEAMVDSPTYNTSLDIFSFGHVMLCVGIQDTPALSLRAGSGGKSPLHGNVEIKRRKKHLDALGEKHCLYPLVIQCLQDNANKRPATKELCDHLQKLSVTHPRCIGDVLKVCGMGKAAMSVSQQRQSDMGEVDHVAVRAEEVASLQERLQEVTKEKEELSSIAYASRQEAAVFKEDFETERRDRVDAHDRFEKEKEDYELQLARLQAQITQQETRHAKQIQHYRTELEIIKAAKAREADNHANIQQLLGDNLEMVSHQLKEEKEKNMRQPVAKPRTNVFSAYKESARHEERAEGDLLNVSSSSSPKHTYVNLMQTLQHNGPSRDVTRSMLPAPPRTEAHREVHSTNRHFPTTGHPQVHVYHEIPGPGSGEDHTRQNASPPLRALRHPQPPLLWPGMDSKR